MLGSRKQNPNQAKKLADVQIAKKDESKQAKEDELRQTIINFFKIYSDNHHPDGNYLGQILGYI